MKYGVDLTSVEVCNQPTCVLCGYGGEVYAPTASLLEHFGHDRERAIGAGPDDQPVSTPGELLVSREGSMPELIAVRLGRLLLPFPHLATRNDYVVVVLPPLDLDGSESD